MGMHVLFFFLTVVFGERLELFLFFSLLLSLAGRHNIGSGWCREVLVVEVKGSEAQGEARREMEGGEAADSRGWGYKLSRYLSFDPA